uniref:Uncharacterized protein MANES_12G141800 n=1 Tax=Rhizophora mucronata TaxID=61149 RepID=A0A2P2LBF8_RHIMU
MAVHPWDRALELQIHLQSGLQPCDVHLAYSLFGLVENLGSVRNSDPIKLLINHSEWFSYMLILFFFLIATDTKNRLGGKYTNTHNGDGEEKRTRKRFSLPFTLIFTYKKALNFPYKIPSETMRISLTASLFLQPCRSIYMQIN